MNHEGETAHTRRLSWLDGPQADEQQDQKPNAARSNPRPAGVTAAVVAST